MLRIIIIAAVLVLTVLYFMSPPSSVGGNFTLTDHNGKPFNSSGLRGKYTLVFFGFTDCPDVCPLTLSKISHALDILNKNHVSAAAVFITVNPGRDTPEQLRSYLSHFNANIMGLTGTEEQIAHVKSLYGAYGDAKQAEKAEHSAYIYLMDSDGKYLTHFSLDATAEDIAARVEGYIDAKL